MKTSNSYEIIWRSQVVFECIVGTLASAFPNAIAEFPNWYPDTKILKCLFKVEPKEGFVKISSSTKASSVSFCYPLCMVTEGEDDSLDLHNGDLPIPSFWVIHLAVQPPVEGKSNTILTFTNERNGQCLPI